MYYCRWKCCFYKKYKNKGMLLMYEFIDMDFTLIDINNDRVLAPYYTVYQLQKDKIQSLKSLNI